MICFHQIGSVWQIALLILSQFTVIILMSGFLVLFRHRSRPAGQLCMAGLFLLNAALYLIMQLQSRITGSPHTPQLHLPCWPVLAAAVLSLIFCIHTVLSETSLRKTIRSTSIKEAIDNLPTGVCFFNEAGLAVLCNHAMYRFGFAVCGRDVQYIADLEGCLEEDFAPAPGVRKDRDVFVLHDGTAWRLEKHTVTQEDGSRYTQFVASDITDLHKSRVALQQETEQLRRVQAELQHLSASVMTVAREEEILNTKMRVHDEMGKCLVAAQKYLHRDNRESIPDSVALAWQRAVSTLKYSNDVPDEDMMTQIRKTCAHVKLAFVQTGTLPGQDTVAYLLTCAVRECVTNAVRYARATELYADFRESSSEASVTVTNNGRPPEGEIREGGGLSTLRRRIERAGGTMQVLSAPCFRLTVTVPKGKEMPYEPGFDR